MNNKENQIKKLLSTNNMSAPDVTKPLKKIGDGNMKKGVDTIFDYGLHTGEKNGIIKGSLGTLGAIGTIYLIYNGIKSIVRKKKDNELNSQQEDKNIESFEEEITCEFRDGIIKEEN